jgi:enoyl-CoA hydratase/carnithine racemase
MSFQDRTSSACLPWGFTSHHSASFQANEMLLSGRKLTAQEACGKGLVSQVFWPGTFTQEVMVRIKELATCNQVVRLVGSFMYCLF